jgi:predicted DNA-binding transcriptional regulator YafY
MDIFDRIYRTHRILRSSRYPVAQRTLQEKLECSRATVSRIIREMRAYLGAPIDYDRRLNGYVYAATGEHPYELPGLWFNASELHALLATQQLLANVQPGLLESHLAPLQSRIRQILESRHLSKDDVGRRVRILRMASRRMDGEHFRTVAGALLQRKRLHLHYHGRERDAPTVRDISPQRLIHYRDNWYLDAWDHGKKALRSFSVDRITKATEQDRPGKDIPDSKLDAHFAGAYGIFAGRPKYNAILRFTAERARWVADEVWHPEQAGRFVDSYYELTIPYSDPRELLLDILKYGPDVEVLAPAALRHEVAERLRMAADLYATETTAAAAGAGQHQQEKP